MVLYSMILSIKEGMVVPREGVMLASQLPDSSFESGKRKAEN